MRLFQRIYNSLQICNFIPAILKNFICNRNICVNHREIFVLRSFTVKYAPDGLLRVLVIRFGYENNCKCSSVGCNFFLISERRTPILIIEFPCRILFKYHNDFSLNIDIIIIIISRLRKSVTAKYNVRCKFARTCKTPAHKIFSE